MCLLSSKISVDEGVAEFLAHRQARLAASTVENDRFLLQRFARTLGGDRQIRYLKPEHIEAWFYGPQGVMAEHRTRDRRLRPAVQPSTHNFYRTRLNALFLFWTKRGYLRADLLTDVQPKKIVRKQRQQPRPDLLLAMLDKAKSDRDRAYLATAMNTGLRGNEILRLRVGDVDLDGGWLSVFISKSQIEDRLPLTSDLDKELRGWLAQYAGDLGHLDETYFLFPARSGNRFQRLVAPDGAHCQVNVPGTWRPDAAMTHPERVVQSALAAVGLPTKHEGTHTLRRAVARHFFDKMVADQSLGYDGALRSVQALLHHESAATTEVYLGLSSERVRRDQSLRGQPFLTAMVSEHNVVPLRRGDTAN